MSTSAYPVTAANRPTRGIERAAWDRATVHAILDATPVCHLAYLDEDGLPITIPTTFARVGERLVLHSSSGGTSPSRPESRSKRKARPCGVWACSDANRRLTKKRSDRKRKKASTCWRN